MFSCIRLIISAKLYFYYGVSQPTTFDHINIKYIWGPHVSHMGTPR